MTSPAAIAALTSTIFTATAIACGGSMNAHPPAKDTFTGQITRATGVFRSDHGRVKVQLIVAGTGTKRYVTVTVDGLGCGSAASCLKLTGSVSGSLVANPANPDIGRSFRVQAGGTVTPLGHVSASGGVQGTGFIAHGHESLELTLESGRGAVTVSGLSPMVPGFTAP